MVVIERARCDREGVRKRWVEEGCGEKKRWITKEGCGEKEGGLTKRR